MRLQLYILRRLTANLALVVLVVSSVIFIAQMLQFLERTPDVGLAFLVTALPLLVPVTLSLTLPLSFLVAALMTYGRLADDNEVIACRMAGIHPWVLVSPGIFAGTALSLAALVLHLQVAPAALAGQDEFRRDAYGRFVQMMESGVRDSFVNRDFKISWGSVKDGVLQDVHISKGGVDEHRVAPRGGRVDEPVQEIRAATAELRRDAEDRALEFVLRDASVLLRQGEHWTVSRMDSWTFSVPVSDLLDLHTDLPNRRALGYGDLLFREFRWEDKEPGRLAATETWGRVGLGLAPLCFALCAIPLALLFGKASRTGAAVLALGVTLVFFVLWQAGGSMAGAGRVPVAAGCLAGNAVLAGAGLVLLRKVART